MRCLALPRAVILLLTIPSFTSGLQYVLTPEGIDYLREFLNLPAEVRSSSFSPQEFTRSLSAAHRLFPLPSRSRFALPAPAPLPVMVLTALPAVRAPVATTATGARRRTALMMPALGSRKRPAVRSRVHHNADF